LLGATVMHRIALGTVVIVTSSLALVACGKSGGGGSSFPGPTSASPPPPSGNPPSGNPPSGSNGPTVSPNAQPDFSLADVNTGSATYGHMVSPRDYITKIAGFYFGHAT
jgi:hypothetical protein